MTRQMTTLIPEAIDSLLAEKSSKIWVGSYPDTTLLSYAFEQLNKDAIARCMVATTNTTVKE